MTEIAVRDAAAGTLALAGDQIEWTPVQQAALAHIGIADAPPADQQVFMHVCQRVRLDPFARQIYMIPRQEGTGQNRKTKWTIQTGIDGFRLIAERHPQYRGQIGPQWCGPDGEWVDVWVSDRPPVAARVGVLRGDRDGPIWGVALFREYAQTTRYDNQVQLTKMWREKGAHMVAKCAEALGLRKAFPVELSGLVTDDETGRADSVGRAAARQVVSAVTAAELTGAPVIDAEPAQPAATARRSRTSAPGKTRASAGAATPAAADPAPQGPPLPGEDGYDEDRAQPGLGDDEIGGRDPDAPATKEQNRHMHALFREAELGGKDDRDARLQLTGLLLNRELDTSKGLTVADASLVITALRNLQGSGHPDGLAGAAADLLNEDDLRREAAREAEAAAEQAAADDDARSES